MPVYTLIVGPELQRLNVPKCVLKTIPYFNKAMNDETIDPDVPFIVENHKAQPLINILAFIRDGSGLFSSLIAEEENILTLTETYIAAYKLELEGIQNAMVDEICALQSCRMSVDPAIIVSFSDTNLTESKLYMLFLQEMAHDFRFGKYRSSTSDLDAKLLSSSMDILKRMSKEDLIELSHQLSMLSASSIRPTMAVKQSPCLFHVHQNTPPCCGKISHDACTSTNVQPDTSNPSSEPTREALPMPKVHKPQKSKDRKADRNRPSSALLKIRFRTASALSGYQNLHTAPKNSSDTKNIPAKSDQDNYVLLDDLSS